MRKYVDKQNVRLYGMLHKKKQRKKKGAVWKRVREKPVETQTKK